MSKWDKDLDYVDDGEIFDMKRGIGNFKKFCLSVLVVLVGIILWANVWYKLTREPIQEVNSYPWKGYDRNRPAQDVAYFDYATRTVYYGDSYIPDGLNYTSSRQAAINNARKSQQSDYQEIGGWEGRRERKIKKWSPTKWDKKRKAKKKSIQQQVDDGEVDPYEIMDYLYDEIDINDRY